MKLPSAARLASDPASIDRSALEDILQGLTSRPKRLHPKLFYDAQGSLLFDRICELPEYYLTRTEAAILRAHAPRFMQSFGVHPVIVELGSGSSRKTRILLDAMDGAATYVPVEISRSHLMAARDTLKERYPRLEVLPVCADFTRPFPLPHGLQFRPTLVFFPGSTLGNFDGAEAIGLLKLMGRLAGDRGAILVGLDLRKDRETLEAAYNDAAGVTAEFNRNVLRRLNREFSAGFDLASFEHRATWAPDEGRIEMHLVSRHEQTVQLGDTALEFFAGESIWTESCYKYEPAQFASLAAEAGLEVDDVWIDGDGWFSVQVLRN